MTNSEDEFRSGSEEVVKPMPDSVDKFLTWEVAGLVLLAVVCVLLMRSVLNQKPPAPKPPETVAPPEAVKTTKALPAFHQLARADLDATAFPKEEQDEALKKYENRRLLTGLEEGDTVTDEALATAATSALLDNPMTASIPATPATTLGGRLKVGDVVELASVNASKGAGGEAGATAQSAVNRAPNLVVVGLPAETLAAEGTTGGGAAPPGVVVLAFTDDKLEVFMKAFGGESLVLVRPNAGANQ
jgi:Flp pilus assembly protein CpaB